MKFFQKKGVAVFLTVMIVIISTLLSFNIRFGNKCKDVIYGFYDGVYSDEGELLESTASHLRKISSAADGVYTIASSYDIDENSLIRFKYSIQDLNLSFRYSANDIDYIYRCYSSLVSSVRDMQNRLNSEDLSDTDRAALDEYKNNIASEVKALDSTGYNESVRSFNREYSRFPVTFLADFAGVTLPEFFM